MNLETIKLVHGVLSLRRFTRNQLIKKTSVNSRTVHSWLGRNRHRFLVETGVSVKGDPILGSLPRRKGRPSQTWILRDDAAEFLSAEIEALPLAAQDQALDSGQDIPASISESLRQAAEAFSLYNRANDPSVRSEAWDWFASFQRSLSATVDRMVRAGREIGREQLSELAWLKGHASSGFIAEPADLSGDVMRVAGIVWDDVCNLPSLAGDALRLDDLVQTCKVTPAIGSLGLLAAIGASSKFHPRQETLDALNAAARRIPNNVYCDGFRDMFSGSLTEELAKRAVPAILEGAVQHRRVFDEDVVVVFNRIDLQELVLPEVRNAYWRCKIELPGSNLNHVTPWSGARVTKTVTTTVTTTMTNATTKARKIESFVQSVSLGHHVVLNDLQRVFEEIAEEAVTFGSKLTQTTGIDMRDPFAAFDARFLTGPVEKIEERDALHN